MSYDEVAFVMQEVHKSKRNFFAFIKQQKGVEKLTLTLCRRYVHEAIFFALNPKKLLSIFFPRQKGRK